jgi:diguanylate cyclase (GGDEF)-like protein
MARFSLYPHRSSLEDRTMAIQANNIIEAKDLNKRRSQKGAVESLVRLQSPPDTLHLTTALQTTLELEEMLSMFLQEMRSHLHIDGLGFRSTEQGLVVQLGGQGRHRASYSMRLLEENLGEISIHRNKLFSEKDLATIEHLLVPLLYPLRNALRYHTAMATAFRDPLTTVSNRAAMEEALPREIERSLRHTVDMCILIIDLDHFKKINDSYGHAVGDCVLRSSAKIMRQSLRTEDHIFRYGGEEFVILLPASDINGAQIVADRIREELESSVCSCDNKICPCEVKGVGVTASIGIAQLSQGDNQHLLFDKADKAVYRAKALGRNQVQQYEA